MNEAPNETKGKKANTYSDIGPKKGVDSLLKPPLEGSSHPKDENSDEEFATVTYRIDRCHIVNALGRKKTSKTAWRICAIYEDQLPRSVAWAARGQHGGRSGCRWTAIRL
jgi:hypothetical protein